MSLEVKVPLKKIYIGNIDGEREASKDNFEQLFYTKDGKYSELMKRDKFIISGRKGTGKTILANYLRKKILESPNNSCNIFKLEDFKRQKLIDLRYQDFNDDEISLFWRWTFLLQMASMIVENEKMKTRLPFSLARRINLFIKKKRPEDIFTQYGLETQRNAKVAGMFKKDTKKTRSIDSEIQYQTTTNFEKKPYFENIDKLEGMIFSYLKKNKEKEISVIYDDLDELENKITDNSSYYHLIINMLETVNSLNIKFSRISKKNTKVIVLLRSDIINNLHNYSSNSNKWITEGTVNLFWLSKRDCYQYENPLMEMILNKIERSVKEYNGLDHRTLFENLFPYKIDNKDPVSYLLDYSYGRPRDIIKYLNIIIEKNPSATRFNAPFFKKCLQDYSKWFYDELKNEISIHENKRVILDGIDLIDNFKRKSFKFDDLEKYYEENKQLYPSIVSLKETITYLYKFGIIGNSWPGPKSHNHKIKYHYAWGYREDSRGKPDFSKSFSVHYALRRHFSM